MRLQTDGLVVGEWMVGESDRLIAILTREAGLVRAFAPRAKNLRDSKVSATQLLSYASFSIYQGKTKCVVSDAKSISVFFGLREQLTQLALAQYFCELASLLVPEGVPSEESLRLLLNALHYLEKQEKPILLLKSIVELRLLGLAGFAPDLVGCSHCHCFEDDVMWFLPKAGVLYCDRCAKALGEKPTRLTPGLLRAMRHILYSDFSQLFAFTLSQEGQQRLSQLTERYLIQHLEKTPKTLSFFHQMAVLEGAI